MNKGESNKDFSPFIFIAYHNLYIYVSNLISASDEVDTDSLSSYRISDLAVQAIGKLCIMMNILVSFTYPLSAAK